MRKILTAGLFVVLGASGAFAQLPIPTPPPILTTPIPIVLTVSGNQAQADVDLAGGIEAALTISFENVVGLPPSALSASATVVNPLDPTLLARLPGPFQVRMPGAFPRLLHIHPTA